MGDGKPQMNAVTALAAEIIDLPPRRRRRAAGRPARRDGQGTVLWARRSAGYDAAIIMTWRECCAGIIDWDTAGRRHHALIEMRDGRPVVA